MKFTVCEGHDLEIQLNFYTLYLYEQEFGSDMIKDTLGVIEVAGDSENGDGKLDFTGTNWTALAKGLWAACKCADDSTPPFKQWAQSLSDVNLFTLPGTFAPLVYQELFRSGVPADLSE